LLLTILCFDVCSQLYRSKPGHQHHTAKHEGGDPADETVEHQVNGVVSPGSTGV
jgi:hypothetical protein